uniref:Uncharacterized protein LOC111138032 isoform X2 n=1 Tax=Crassostrea virginica TaxID=6565 RepID=A0A8B8EZY5_CRAVI|nr:uncharacterized protein LOC111138032 isoform X2 [Crassostrea virginica]
MPRCSLRSTFSVLCTAFAIYTLVFMLNVFTPYQRKSQVKDNLLNLTRKDVLYFDSHPTTNKVRQNISHSVDAQVDVPDDKHSHELDRKLLEDMYFKIDHKEALLFGNFRKKRGILGISFCRIFNYSSTLGKTKECLLSGDNFGISYKAHCSL